MIPVANPHAQYVTHRIAIDAAIAAALAQPQLILGPIVEQFERAFAQWTGSAHAVGVGTGTDALFLALRAHDIGPGDEVITVSHTAVATIAAIVQTGATPVVIDVDPHTRTLDPQYLPTALTPKTRAILPVHLYGHPAAIQAICDFAQQHQLIVIEDCAQAIGAAIGSQQVGTFGLCGCFSFYPTKNLGAMGDGGMIITNDAPTADRLRVLREYGWRERYVSTLHGWNSRLDVIQAAILGAKLPHLTTWNQRRQQIAARYTDVLRDHSQITLPATAPGCTPVFHQYVVESPQRDRLAQDLAAHGIGSAVHYPVPVHRQSGYTTRVRCSGTLAITEQLARTILSIPIYPELTEADLLQITAALYNFATHAGPP